jgi:hypothetical protein
MSTSPHEPPSPPYIPTAADFDARIETVFRDGHREVVFPDRDAAERQRRARAEANEQARLQTERTERDARVKVRVKQYVEAGYDAPDAATANGALVRHLAWLALAERQAAVADSKAVEVAQALAWTRSTQAALDQLAAETDAELGHWATHGSDGRSPVDRGAERERLQRDLENTRGKAALSEIVSFECAVAAGAVEALSEIPGPGAGRSRRYLSHARPSAAAGAATFAFEDSSPDIH